MDEPIVWVGGQPEGAGRPKRWPYFMVPVAFVGLVAVVALSWSPLRAAGQSLAGSMLPYTVGVTGQWSSQDKVVCGPVSMQLSVKNTDPRALQGMTLRLKGLRPGWRILGASPAAHLASDSVYFPQTLTTNQSEDLTVKLMPLKSGSFTLQLTIDAGRTATAMRLQTSSTTVAMGLNAPADVRDPVPDDYAVTPQLLYVPDLGVGQPASWDVQVQNAGAVRITSVTVLFPDLPDSFQVTDTTPSAQVTNSGHSIRFPVTLDPGDGQTMTVRFVPHTAGTFHIAAQLFLSDQPDPIVLPNGDRAVNFDVTVS